MHPTGEVKTDPVGLPAGTTEYHPTVVLHPLGCLVEERVFGVVQHTVGDDEVEIALELFQAPVMVCVNALPHGGEVHGVRDVVQIVRNLQEMLSVWKYFWVCVSESHVSSLQLWCFIAVSLSPVMNCHCVQTVQTYNYTLLI